MWKVEVQADGTGTWCGNGLTFASRELAETYGIDLAIRWTAVRDWRVVEIPVPADAPAYFEKNAAERIVYNADGTTEVDYDSR